MTDTYQVYAIRYASLERTAADNFIGGDPHNGPMPLDFYVWAIVGENRTIMVDLGFDLETARRRNRLILKSLPESMATVGIKPELVHDVIVTHMHYDHAGNQDLFPNATYHIQDKEMAFCTGRCMGHDYLRHPYECADVVQMVRRTFNGKVTFHDGSDEIAPGVEVHLVGGHTQGLQVVRVNTRRGWIVLASDACHFYANLEQDRLYPIVFSAAEMLEGYRTVRRLADSDLHIVPGHDPLVIQRYPAAMPELAGFVARVDLEPLG
jgi:glyoxylase-like metal-dependent hydrolase (beta-lactamase superfamily II)